MAGLLGGLIFPQALGVGYETIGQLLQGDVPRTMIVGILLVKSAIWAISLGSGSDASFAVVRAKPLSQWKGLASAP